MSKRYEEKDLLYPFNLYKLLGMDDPTQDLLNNNNDFHKNCERYIKQYHPDLMEVYDSYIVHQYHQITEGRITYSKLLRRIQPILRLLFPIKKILYGLKESDEIVVSSVPGVDHIGTFLKPRTWNALVINSLYDSRSPFKPKEFPNEIDISEIDPIKLGAIRGVGKNALLDINKALTNYNINWFGKYDHKYPNGVRGELGL